MCNCSLPCSGLQDYTKLLPDLSDLSDLWMHEYQGQLFTAARQQQTADQPQQAPTGSDVPMQMLSAINSTQPQLTQGGLHFVQMQTHFVPLHVYNDALARIMRQAEVHHLARDIKEAASSCASTMLKLLAGSLFRHAKLLGANQVGSSMMTLLSPGPHNDCATDLSHCLLVLHAACLWHTGERRQYT